MCPLISSWRMSRACSSASWWVSANLTPPAFMRPPVRTWDLMTVGPPMRSAIARASAALVVKPKSVTGMPARLTTSRASYSKNLMRRGSLHGRGRREPVGLGQLGVLPGEHFSEADHHLALLPGGVVLHLAVDHVHAAPVGDGLDDLFGEGDLVGVGRVDLLGDGDLGGVQRPGADAAEQEGGAELGLAPLLVADVAVGTVEGQRADGGAGVDHARDGVVPRVLLVAGTRRIGVAGVGVGDGAVAGVPAADAGGLHAPRGGQVGGPEAHALDPRRGAGDLLEVGHALRGLQDAMYE